MKKPISIVLVDDHPVITDGIKQIIDLDNELKVVAIFNSLKEAKDYIFKNNINIAVIDINFKDELSGLTLAKQIDENKSGTKTIIFSMFDEKFYAKKCIESGASGYVMKSQSTSTLIEAIKQVHAGEHYFSKDFKDYVFSIAAGKKNHNYDFNLTPKEFEIFRLIGKGKKNQEIADMVNISIKTVESYRSKIREKTGVSNLAELKDLAYHFVKEDS